MSHRAIASRTSQSLRHFLRGDTCPNRHFGRRWVLCVAGALVGFLLANMAVAATVLYSPPRRVDALFGDVFGTGTFVRGHEGYCVTRVSRNGLRAPEPAAVLASPVRILFVGDSYTEAEQVMDTQTFVLRVQEMLRARGEDAVCINGGLSAMSPAGYLYLADAFRKTYHPTRTVVQVGDGDFGSELFNRRRKGYWVVRTSTGLVAERGGSDARRTWARGLLARVPVAQWLFLKWQSDSTSEDTASAASLTVDQALVEEIVGRLRTAYGPNTIVVYAPSIDYFGNPAQPTITESAVHSACESLGLTFVDTRAAFADSYAKTKQPLSGFWNTSPGKGHWNAAGHSVVASEVVRALGATSTTTATSPVGRASR